jgi:hypothetical protein
MSATQQQMTPIQAIDFGMKLEAKKYFPAAERAYREIIAGKPDCHPAYHRRGLIGRFDEAIAEASERGGIESRRLRSALQLGNRPGR